MENVTGPEVPYIFAFESEFQPKEAKAWMQGCWHISVLASVIYAITIHVGQHVMSKRAAMDLRTSMTAWSAILAVFSICGSIRILPTMWHIINNHGYFTLICNNRFYYFDGSGFWTWAFATSKLFELGDTIFIVLRKQKLSFLHWYHHITVFIYCWYSYGCDSTSGLVFGGMNYVIHSLMYTYYTLRALKVALPKILSMLLTSLQILQMFIGIAVTVTIFTLKYRGYLCPETNKNIALAFVMYFSYLVLFAHFFYQRYLSRQTARRTPPTSPKSTETKLNNNNGVNGTTNGVKATANGVKVMANGVKNGVKNGVSNGVSGHRRNVSNGHAKAN